MSAQLKILQFTSPVLCVESLITIVMNLSFCFQQKEFQFTLNSTWWNIWGTERPSKQAAVKAKFYYILPTKLLEGNVLSRVCLSVCLSDCLERESLCK